MPPLLQNISFCYAGVYYVHGRNHNHTKALIVGGGRRYSETLLIGPPPGLIKEVVAK